MQTALALKERHDDDDVATIENNNYMNNDQLILFTASYRQALEYFKLSNTHEYSSNISTLP